MALQLPGVTVGILLGNGDGTFQSEAEYTTGTSPYGVVAGDFNRDGNWIWRSPITARTRFPSCWEKKGRWNV